MNTLPLSWLLLLGLFLFSASKSTAQIPASELVTKFRTLTATTPWKQVAHPRVPGAPPAGHGQNRFLLLHVVGGGTGSGGDRAAGKGVGHLFKFDADGKLLADVRLGEGAMYHLGGTDFDGRYLWVPVAEYRANSRSIVYKVDTETMGITEVFRFGDHIGGLVHDTDSHTLHGITWGSRIFYEWPLETKGTLSEINPSKVPVTPNPSYYIDYQDCHYVGNHYMLCGGLKNYKNGSSTFGLGGLELVNLTDHRPVHQVPLALWSPTGRPMTQNPFWLESTETGFRAYFVPDDDAATLFVYEVAVE